MIEVIKAGDRGDANLGWLKSRHTFSFGSYYDQQKMGFSALRVINDDTVSPGAGFDTHGHKDMEIISYVTKGVIEHKDSMGNVQRLPKGEFQLMSAGKGVMHSEYNASPEEELKFLQIWIVPNEQGGTPGYQQKEFGNKPGLTRVITPHGEQGTLKIKQQASLSQLILEPGSEMQYNADVDAKYYVHQIEGNLELVGETLEPGDGMKILGESQLSLQNSGTEVVVALLFELP